jgi:hypothetical protein
VRTLTSCWLGYLAQRWGYGSLLNKVFEYGWIQPVTVNNQNAAGVR